MSQVARGLDEKVGPYQLVRAIGAGGSARIDLARIDRAYGFVRHVVIKRPLEHLRGDRNVALSLQREARIGGRLRHPNLVAVLDAGMHDNYDYLVLEYVHGTSLRELMQTETGGEVRALPLAVGLGIVIDIARGLHDAHQLADDKGEPLGLVHRDVSPGNVLLGLDGSVKVADFGIAKETRVTTLSGSMHGTVTYMAPEQCRGHAFDRRADIWALGVILHELVTHQRLFWADNDVASLHKVLSGQVPRLRKIDPTISAALEDIVMTAVAQEPAGRFANARDMADALEAFAANQGHVVGARWLARTVEEFAGPRPAPWIPSTTVPDLKAITESISLVDVLERSVEPDADAMVPTFGVVDERAAEEGALPRASTAVTQRRSKLPWVIVGAAVIGVGLGAGFEMTTRAKTPPADVSAVPITPTPITPTPPIVHTVPPPVDPPTTVPVPTVPTVPIVIEASGSNTSPAKNRRRVRVTNPPASGSNAEVATAPIISEPEKAAGSGSGSGSSATAVTPHVEWKPTDFFPPNSKPNKP